MVLFRTFHQRLIEIAKESYVLLLELAERPGAALEGALRSLQDLVVLFEVYAECQEQHVLPFCRKAFSQQQQGQILRACLGLPPAQYHDHLVPFIIEQLAPEQQQQLFLCLAATLPAAQFKLYSRRITESFESEEWVPLKTFLRDLMPTHKKRKSSKR